MIGGSSIGEMVIYPGEEPADVAYNFVVSHGLDDSYKDSILTQACVNLPCSRTRALLFDSPVLSESGALIGNIEIFEGDEPADVAFEFSNLHNLTEDYFDAILADACDNVECTRVEPVIFRLPVDLGEGEEVELTIFDGEDPIEAVAEFCSEHELDEEAMEALLAEADENPLIQINWDIVTRLLSGEEVISENPGEGALLYSVPVQDEEGELIGVVDFYDHQEPADVVYNFCQNFGLNEQYRNAILANACEVIECHRVEAAIFSLPVNVAENEIVSFVVLEGEHPRESIKEFCMESGLGEECRKVLTQKVAEQIEFDHEAPIVWDQEVRIDEETTLGRIHLYEGDEPADGIYDFLHDKELSDDMYIRVRDFLTDVICKRLICNRRRAVVWSESIATEDGEYIGDVQVLEGVEPIDAIHAFTTHYNLDLGYRQSILAACCEEIECTRDKRVVFQHDVDTAQGPLGKLEITEGEEVVDAVVKFIYDYQADVDIISFKNYFFEQACDRGLDLLCTRNVAVLVNIGLVDDDGNSLGQLVVREGQDPVEELWIHLSQIIEDEKSRIDSFAGLKPKVCRMPYAFCKSKGIIIFQQAISGPGGTTVGVLEVFAGEEPVDATYRFFAKNGLFEKDWDFKAVFKQVCELEGLKGKCIRQEAIKFLEENKVIDGIKIGHLVVWEHEEVIDVLYRKRIEYGLTIKQQMALFNEICSSEEVYCKMTRAAVYRRSVNKLDYDTNTTMVYGNATCDRKYMGWRFISGWDEAGLQFNETWVGPFKQRLSRWGMTDDGKVKIRPMKKIVNMLNDGYATSICGEPTFILYYIAGWYVLARLICWRVGVRMGWGGRFFGWRRIGLVSNALLFVTSVLSASFFYVWGIEPDPNIDMAMHNFMGKLPDLEILEGQYVADAVWKWAKDGEKKHHPLLRQPVHWGLIDEICNDENLQKDLIDKCTRRKAHIAIDMGAITTWGLKHDIIYWKSPNKTFAEELEEGIVESAAIEMCDRIVPSMNNCYADINKHINDQYEHYESIRFDKKNMYTLLGVQGDASTDEVWRAARKSLNYLGDNFPPFSRIDNGTKVEHSWSARTHQSYAIKDKLEELLDAEKREWYDKPCEPVFGGAMCAKKDAGGNMMIEMGAGEE